MMCRNNRHADFLVWCVTNMLTIPIMPNGIGSMAIFHILRPQDLDRANAVVGPGGCRVATAVLPFVVDFVDSCMERLCANRDSSENSKRRAMRCDASQKFWP